MHGRRDGVLPRKVGSHAAPDRRRCIPFRPIVDQDKGHALFSRCQPDKLHRRLRKRCWSPWIVGISQPERLQDRVITRGESKSATILFRTAWLESLYMHVPYQTLPRDHHVCFSSVSSALSTLRHGVKSRRDHHHFSSAVPSCFQP